MSCSHEAGSSPRSLRSSWTLRLGVLPITRPGRLRNPLTHPSALSQSPLIFGMLPERPKERTGLVSAGKLHIVSGKRGLESPTWSGKGAQAATVPGFRVHLGWCLSEQMAAPPRRARDGSYQHMQHKATNSLQPAEQKCHTYSGIPSHPMAQLYNRLQDQKYRPVLFSSMVEFDCLISLQI